MSAVKAVASSKLKSSRRAWTSERFEVLIRAVAASVKALGASFARPAQPAEVPKDAPDTNGEWAGCVNDILALVPRYRDLLSRRKSADKKKGHNGGLQQHIYLTKQMTDFLNNSGVLGKAKLPIDQISGGLGICTRALFTSAIVSYVESRGLKHPTERRYIARDQYLQALIGEVNFEYLKTAKPKTEKKRKEGAKPKKHTEKVKMLDRDGQQVLHFSFDAIPTVCGFFIVPLPPRAINEQQAAELLAVREHLKDLTTVRKGVRSENQKAERVAKKKEKVQQNIVPTQVLTMNAPAPSAVLPQLGFNPGK